MKTKNVFTWSLLSLVVSVAAMFFYVLYNSSQQQNYSFMVIIVAQVASTTFVLMNWPKQKPNYNWDKIADGNCFKIIYIYEYFEDTEIESRKMIVNVDFFGETLMYFPNESNYWNSQKPEIGERYMKYKNNLMKLKN